MTITITIIAPELVLLDWRDMACERYIRAQLSQFPHPRSLGSFPLVVYGLDRLSAYNRAFLAVLKGIQFLENLTLRLAYVEVSSLDL